MIILPYARFPWSGCNLPVLHAHSLNPIGERVPTAGTAQPPRTLWLLERDLVTSPRAPETFDQGNWMLQISSGINLNRSSIFFFCFVDVFKSLHTFRSWMDFACCCCCCYYLFLVGTEPLQVDSVPTRLNSRSWDLLPRVLRIARWKIARRKDELALSVKTYSEITNFLYF